MRLGSTDKTTENTAHEKCVANRDQQMVWCSGMTRQSELGSLEEILKNEARNNYKMTTKQGSDFEVQCFEQ